MGFTDDEIWRVTAKSKGGIRLSTCLIFVKKTSTDTKAGVWVETGVDVKVAAGTTVSVGVFDGKGVEEGSVVLVGSLVGFKVFVGIAVFVGRGDGVVVAEGLG